MENSSASLKTLFQKAFTKGAHSAGSQKLKYADACDAVSKAFADASRVQRFINKQLCKGTEIVSESSGQMQRAYERMQHELTRAQQTMSSMRVEAEQKEQTLQSQLAGAKQQLSQEQARNHDLVQQVENFRRHVASPRASSSHGGGNSSTGSGHRHQQVHQPPFQHRQIGPDPTPIRIAPSFDSSRSISHAPAPPFRDTRSGGQQPQREYGFSSRSGAHSSSSGGGGMGVGMGGGGGGPIRQMRSYSSRPSGYSRRSGSGSGLLGRR